MWTLLMRQGQVLKSFDQTNGPPVVMLVAQLCMACSYTYQQSLSLVSFICSGKLDKLLIWLFPGIRTTPNRCGDQKKWTTEPMPGPILGSCGPGRNWEPEAENLEGDHLQQHI